MKKLLLPVAVLAFFALPSLANAETCRTAKGQFAKCGTPGAIPAGMKTAKHGILISHELSNHPGAMAPAKAGPCKDAKGKFIKCGAAAAPAKPAPAMAAKPMMAPAKPMMAPAKPAMAPAKPMAPAKKAPCKNDKGKFVKCAA